MWLTFDLSCINQGSKCGSLKTVCDMDHKDIVSDASDPDKQEALGINKLLI